MLWYNLIHQNMSVTMGCERCADHVHVVTSPSEGHGTAVPDLLGEHALYFTQKRFAWGFDQIERSSVELVIL